MLYYEIPTWADYQHYKDRDPPWIKLHFSLLTSPSWVMLDDASRVLAIACMLIASRNHGKVPADTGYIQRVAYLSSADFQPLLNIGFLKPSDDLLASASTMQAKATTEERRGETETEKKVSAIPKKKASKTLLPANFSLTPEIESWAQEKGYSRLHERMEYFVGVAKAKGYEYADWVQAFQNSVREDWAKLNGKAAIPSGARIVGGINIDAANALR